MKKTADQRTAESIRKVPGIGLKNANEREALQAAVKVLNEQNEQLGLLDPLDAEPATLFFAEEAKQ
jgi:hypothetical protein